MPEYVFEIVEGPEAGRRINVSGPLELGRDPSVGGPILQDDLVSGHHVRVTPEADGVRVEDLGSRNGTFVDGDQIYSPAHVAIDGHLLIGVTDLQLRPAEPAAIQGTAVRPIPQSLTVLRPLPTAADAPPPASTRVIAVPAEAADFAPPAAPAEPAEEAHHVPSLAVPESEPEYVPASALEDRQSDAGALLGLLDTHTKGKARGAPIGLFVLAALAVILFLALR